MKLVLPLCCLFCISAPWSVSSQPNVVIFLTDDQGWGDLSANGNSNLSTPNIDSLARDGATLDNFYVCAVCAPTRAEFLTGRYHSRTGVSGVSTGEGRLNLDETTIADVFRSSGYATGAFGKWHNGTQPPYHPNDRGFDEFYGFTSGHWGHYFSPPLDHNGKRVQGNGYVVDDFTDHAMAFIEKNRNRPFFCYVPYNTPHSPMMVDDEFYEKFADFEPEMRNRDPEKEDIMMTRAALAMCENIDWNVGRILRKLDSLNLSENTIVIFFSDNGPNSLRWNGGMKGKKGSVDEGGLRSPFFLRWSGKIEAGVTIKEVGAAIDLLPTLKALAGIEGEVEKPLDGVDLSALLTGDESKLKPRIVYSAWRKKFSLRTNRFRLDSSGKLFDISEDRGQSKDVSDQHPALVRELRSRLSEFQKETMKNYAANSDRPFSVGFGESTTLPARDGIPHGTIRRSSKAPNNSFFENWTSAEDSITWDIQTSQSGVYEAIVYYTCAESDLGVGVTLGVDGGESTSRRITQAHDPPFYSKAKERVSESHYYVKDFKPISLGVFQMEKGRSTLRLSSSEIVGEEAIDVYSVVLNRK